MSRSQSHRNDRKQTEARIQVHEQGTAGTASHKPKPEHAKRGPQTGARTNPTSIGGVTTSKDERKPHANWQVRAGSEFRVVERSWSQALACVRWECLLSQT